MFAVIRLSAVAFLVLSIIYICVSLYSRMERRRKLEAAWDAGDRNGDWRVDEDDEEPEVFTDKVSYMQAGMDRYDASLRKKLILGIYIFPVALVGFLIYATNFM